MAAPAAASDQTDALATVHHFGDSLNAGDVKALLATCASQPVIIDEFAPHVWQGVTACSDWLKAAAAYEEASGITEGHLAFGTPWRVEVTGERAYVVVPMTYTYLKKGSSVVEAGSIWTLVLLKFADGWRVAGMSWGQH